MSKATGNGKLIESLVADREVVALTFKRKLESIDGPGVPIFPPTYPAPEKTGIHRHDTPYTVNETKDGVLVCDLDSVQSQANRMEAAFTRRRPAPTTPDQSQANRMEAAFTDGLAGVVPQHAVQAGDHRVELTKLPHRIVDASIRATDLADDIREWMRDFERGKPVPLAKAAPTSLVYGAWDSRDTQVKIPRVVRSEIRAHDVSVFTRSAQYSGAFKREELGIDEKIWSRKKGGAAGVGLAPTPATDDDGARGGILAHGEIVHSASILLNAIRKYRTDDGSDVLPNYLLGLALGGLLVGGGDYDLRSGCSLVPAAPAEWRAVTRGGERRSIEVDESAVLEEVDEIAKKWSETAGVALGGEPKDHEFKIAKAMAMFEEKKG